MRIEKADERRRRWMPSNKKQEHDPEEKGPKLPNEDEEDWQAIFDGRDVVTEDAHEQIVEQLSLFTTEHPLPATT